jgi:hypothetical protein
MKDVRDREDDRGDRERSDRERDDRRERDAPAAGEERKGMASTPADDDFL